jgi:NAD dependent epimerase/dehydratase family enzyme
MFSWVHVEDVCRSIEWCYENHDVEGIYNCVSPNAVSNDTLMRTMRNFTGHKIGLPAFDWMLEMGAALIGTETELILKSRWVLPAKLLNQGFCFKYEKIEDAIGEVVSKTPRKHYHLF